MDNNTFNVWMSLIAAVSAIVAAFLSNRNRVKLTDMHGDMNGRLADLLEAASHAAELKGYIRGRAALHSEQQDKKEAKP